MPTRKQWMDADRRDGHVRYEVLVPVSALKKAWDWLFKKRKGKGEKP